MKIDVSKIPVEGLSLEQDFTAVDLDLETETIKFRGPLNVKAEVSLITNAVTVDLELSALIQVVCGRCLKKFDVDFKKALTLNYLTGSSGPVIDLSTDIREEVILDYPIKALCSLSCKGLCPKCGKDLNNGECGCGK